MLVTYGQGEFRQGERVWQGRLMMSEHKLYLSGPAGDLTETYIPLEKIKRVRRAGGGMTVEVRPSLTTQYAVDVIAPKKLGKELLNDLVSRRQLRRRFLRQEWFDPEP